LALSNFQKPVTPHVRTVALERVQVAHHAKPMQDSLVQAQALVLAILASMGIQMLQAVIVNE